MNLLFLAMACTRAPIEDRWTHGSITQLKDSFTSTFVVETTSEDSTAWIAIDTGYNKNADPLNAFLEENGATIDSIEHVVITHGHGDHIGAHVNFPNAKFYVHEKDLPLLEAESISNIQTFNESSSLDVSGVTFTPFFVPGHTEGNVAFLVNDVLIMGDSAQSHKDGSISVSTKFAEDAELAVASLEGLKDAISPYQDQIAWTVFSHSGPLEGVDAILEYTAP